MTLVNPTPYGIYTQAETEPFKQRRGVILNTETY